MAVNYNDERFDKVETDKQAAMNEMEQTYDGMIGASDEFYDKQINASKEWADKQTELQKESHAFDLEQIEQQKEQTQKDYLKEQSGAFADWQKQSAQHGVNAEQMAAAGLAGSGFSESSQVRMYNTYQNRVATARDAYSRAVLNYDNAINAARLQNNSALAEIAYAALQQQLELSLAGFQYKNQLILDKANKKTELDNIYYGRYMDVLNQINYENEFAEQVRQFEMSYSLQLEQIAEQRRQFQLEYDESVRQFNAELERLKAKDTEDSKREAERIQLAKDELAEKKRQFDKTLEFEESQLKNKASSGGSVYGGSIAGAAGGAAGVSSSKSSALSTPLVNKNANNNNAVNTAYYSGSLNPDAKKYGTFDNGYQPKGISGHGTLSKTGDTITLSTVTLSGQRQTVIQNVWKASNGTLWYWEGRQNKYIQISNSGGSGGGGAGGGGGVFGPSRVYK